METPLNDKEENVGLSDSNAGLERERLNLEASRLMWCHTKNWLRMSLFDAERRADAVEARLQEVRKLLSNVE